MHETSDQSPSSWSAPPRGNVRLAERASESRTIVGKKFPACARTNRIECEKSQRTQSHYCASQAAAVLGLQAPFSCVAPPYRRLTLVGGSKLAQLREKEVFDVSLRATRDMRQSYNRRRGVWHTGGRRDKIPLVRGSACQISTSHSTSFMHDLAPFEKRFDGFLAPRPSFWKWAVMRWLREH